MTSRRVFVVRRLLVGAAVAGLALAPPAQAAGPERPYKGSCSTVVTPVTPPNVVPQELHITSDCILTHLGRTTGVAQQFVTPTGQQGQTVTLLIQNTGVYTAANGDQLRSAFLGTALLDLTTGDVRFIGTESFDGGTGRFAQATGSDQLEGTASIVTNRGFFSVKGSLAY